MRRLADFSTRAPGRNVSLGANERLAVAAGDLIGSGCEVATDLYGPSTMEHFASQPIFQWTDGKHAGGSAASHIGAAPAARGAGGHFVAPVAGTYRVRVRSSTFSSSPCIYRIFLARPGQFYQAMPTW